MNDIESDYAALEQIVSRILSADSTSCTDEEVADLAIRNERKRSPTDPTAAATAGATTPTHPTPSAPTSYTGSTNSSSGTGTHLRPSLR